MASDFSLSSMKASMEPTPPSLRHVIRKILGEKNIYGIKKYKKNTNKARKDTKYKEKHQKKGVPGVNWLQQETLLMEPYAIPRDFIGKPAGSGRSPAFAMLPKACSSGIPAKPARDRMATETHASKT